MDYLSSDTHFFHRNIIQYCDRPFKDVSHMNEMMIKAHNEVVTNEDTWHFLGDFAFCGVEKHAEILKRMNGKKKIIYTGNHDWKNKPEKLLKLGWDEVKEGPIDWEYGGIKFRLCHFPYAGHDHTLKIRYADMRPSREGIDWLLCGHVHNHWNVLEKMINVGVDNWEYRPLSMDYIVKMVKTLEGTEVDATILERIYPSKKKEE